MDEKRSGQESAFVLIFLAISGKVVSGVQSVVNLVFVFCFLSKNRKLLFYNCA